MPLSIAQLQIAGPDWRQEWESVNAGYEMVREAMEISGAWVQLDEFEREVLCEEYRRAYRALCRLLPEVEQR